MDVELAVTDGSDRRLRSSRSISPLKYPQPTPGHLPTQGSVASCHVDVAI
eukprot:COSAG01_NODE_51985_length_350_cov_0.776892_1_plen_49_part_01